MREASLNIVKVPGYPEMIISTITSIELLAATNDVVCMEIWTVEKVPESFC